MFLEMWCWKQEKVDADSLVIVSFIILNLIFIIVLTTISVFPRCCHRGHDSLQHSSSVAGQHGFCSSITRRQEALISSALEANADIDPHQEGLQTAQAVATCTSASSLKTWCRPSRTGQHFFDKTNLILSHVSAPDPEPVLWIDASAFLQCTQHSPRCPAKDRPLPE